MSAYNKYVKDNFHRVREIMDLRGLPTHNGAVLSQLAADWKRKKTPKGGYIYG